MFNHESTEVVFPWPDGAVADTHTNLQYHTMDIYILYYQRAESTKHRTSGIANLNMTHNNSKH